MRIVARFTVSIDTDSAAFCDEDGYPDPMPELTRILHNVAERLSVTAGAGTARDINGNTVGSFGWAE